MSGDDFFANLPYVGRVPDAPKEEGRQILSGPLEPEITGSPSRTLKVSKPKVDDVVSVAAAALKAVPYHRLGEFWALVDPGFKRAICMMGDG